MPRVASVLKTLKPAADWIWPTIHPLKPQHITADHEQHGSAMAEPELRRSELPSQEDKSAEVARYASCSPSLESHLNAPSTMVSDPL